MTTNNQPAQTLASAKSIEITEQALEHIRQAMAKEGMAASEGGLRLGVQGGGCSGMSYSIRIDKQPRQRDRVFQFGEVRVFVDPKSFVYLQGTTLDWKETLMHRGFVFVNPNAQKTCGCGSSFS
ncbi:MAG: iron-sulfur cluster assembly accessory protein [Candidatus Korobacteraceae bacterium]|jgi:iron-sulfur cluster assembly protein